MTVSAIYEGTVFHRRLGPRPHEFRQSLYLMYLDLEELPSVFAKRWFWSVDRPNLVSFRREDYLGPEGRPLRDAVLDRVENELGRRPAGPVRILTLTNAPAPNPATETSRAHVLTTHNVPPSTPSWSRHA